MQKRRWKWSNSFLATWAKQIHPRDPHDAILKVCQNTQFDGIEGAPMLFEGLTLSELEPLGRTYAQAGVSIYSFHLPPSTPGLDISAFYESVRKQAVDSAKRWMERAAALGAKVVIQHPTAGNAAVEDEGVDRYLVQLDKSLKTLLPFADSLELSLALENMLPAVDGTRFGSDPDHFRRIDEAFGHSALSFCLDTGHALVACHDQAERMFKAMESRLSVFHLSDNAGDRDLHLAPGYGCVDWTMVFQNMARIGYEGLACIDAPPFAYGPRYSLKSFSDLIEQTDRLVARALLELAEVYGQGGGDLRFCDL